LAGRPSHAGPHTGRAARSKRRARASSVRECGSALGIQRRISSRPVAIPGRSRCPRDQDLDDSDAAVNGGMRDDYYRLRSRSRYGAADLSCLTGEPLATRRQEPFELAGVGACLPNPYRNHVFVRNDGLDPHAQVRKTGCRKPSRRLPTSSSPARCCWTHTGSASGCFLLWTTGLARVVVPQSHLPNRRQARVVTVVDVAYRRDVYRT
jgi:hypothetical protein